MEERGLKIVSVFDRLGWSKEQADDFFGKYTAEVLNSAPLLPGAKCVLDELRKLGNKLVCVTLRGYYRDCEVEITERRLREEGVVFDKIIYSQKNKLAACKAEGVDVIVDDNPNTIELLSENGIKCLHFRGAGLKKVENTNVVDVQNWACILEEILKLSKEKRENLK